MHQRTERLVALMTQRNLTVDDVGAMLGKSTQTVRIWRCKNDDRIIPANMLRLLELELKANPKSKAA